MQILILPYFILFIIIFMKKMDLSKLTKNSWLIFWIIFLSFLIFANNVSAIAWILWYWSNNDYSNPTSSFSWSISVWSWETLTWTTLATFSNAVQVSNSWITVVIPSNTQVASSSWGTFNATTISTNLINTLPVSLATNQQDVWKITFWISWVNLYFSKPIKLQIPVSTTNSTVQIFAKHAWIGWYQTYSLTDTLASNCNNWVATPTSNIASVVSWIATIYTCSASDFVAVTNTVVSSSSWGWSSSSSSWGGGGWSSRILHIDNCPKWDFSKSYYDKDCWTATVLISKVGTGSINSTGSTVKNDDNSLNEEEVTITSTKKRTVNYKWINIVVIDWYKLSQNVAIVTKKIIESENLSVSEKQIYINRFNEFLIAKYNLDVIRKKTVTLKNQYLKQFFLLKWVIKNLKKS